MVIDQTEVNWISTGRHGQDGPKHPLQCYVTMDLYRNQLLRIKLDLIKFYIHQPLYNSLVN